MEKLPLISGLIRLILARYTRLILLILKSVTLSLLPVVEIIRLNSFISLKLEEKHIIKQWEDGVVQLIHQFLWDEYVAGWESEDSIRDSGGYVIVPEGPPIVRLRNVYSDELVGPHNNVQNDGAAIGCAVEIDRVLDYNLLVYVEIQTLSRPSLGNEVRRRRLLLALFKGAGRFREIDILIGADEFPVIYAGNSDEHVQSSISILPYTEMEKIDLPTEIDHGTRDLDYLPLGDRVISEGHTFRPYRIASSSYLIGNEAVGQDW